MSPNPLPQPLVLIVENDIDTREMYAEMLVQSGVRVIQSGTFEDALTKARTFRPDIITMDLGLGSSQDGCQLTADLKHDVRTNRIPVVAVTAWVMGGYVERAFAVGCDSVLLKPVLPHTLLAEIVRLLGKADDTTYLPR